MPIWPLIRWAGPYLVGAGILAGLAVGVLWYGHSRYEAGRADEREAQRVAGLEEFQRVARQLSGISGDLQTRIDQLADSRPKVIERYTREIVQAPLPAGCVRDPGRVRATNAGIDAANAARQSVPAVPANPAR